MLLAVAWGAQLPAVRRRIFRFALGFLLLLQAAGTALTHGDMHREAIQWVIAHHTGKEQVLVSSTLVNSFAFRYLNFPDPKLVTGLERSPSKEEKLSIEARIKRTFGKDTRGFIFLYHDDAEIDERMDKLREEGYLLDYRTWIFARDTKVLAFVRTLQEEAWLQSLPPLKIPWGPRSLDLRHVGKEKTTDKSR